MATLVQGIRMALHYAENNMDLKEVFGEDVGPPLGGAFTATQGIECSWNSPLDERGIIGAAMGLGFAGDRCVAEIQFCDYIFNTIDLLKLCGNACWSSHGDWPVPITVMTPVGSGIRGSLYHSHSFDATATHIPGWKIVMPSNALDAYGLMLSCIEDDNPCFFLKPKALLRTRGEEAIPGEPALTKEGQKELSQMIDMPVRGEKNWKPSWPSLEKYMVPIGKGKVVREGQGLTVVSYGRTLPLCQKAAMNLEKEGFDVEVIDMRTLWPYDWDLISGSIRKTGRVIFVNEDTEVTNFGEHLLRRTVDELFYELQAKPRVLAGAFTPGVGLADALEMVSVPQLDTIEAALREVGREQP